LYFLDKKGNEILVLRWWTTLLRGLSSSSSVTDEEFMVYCVHKDKPLFQNTSIAKPKRWTRNATRPSTPKKKVLWLLPLRTSLHQGIDEAP
jgi:hypothetical protein